MHFGQWNPLAQGLGGSKAISHHLNFRLRWNHVSARAAAGEAAGQPIGNDHLSFVDKAKSALQNFPTKAALTAGGLALTGDTIAQVFERSRRKREVEAETKDMSPCCRSKELEALPKLWDHDMLRALRMASYGFLFYGPFSHVWYAFLDRRFPGKSLKSFLTKVTANQVVLGPLVVVVVYAYNFAWMNKLKDLPAKYQHDLFPTLVDGWKFWIPVALFNFGLVPLQARVAFMSSASIFWNFYLSMSIAKKRMPAARLAGQAPVPANAGAASAEIPAPDAT